MNNNAAIGYAVIAAEELGLSGKTVERLAFTIKSLMDEIPEDVAEQAYKDL